VTVDAAQVRWSGGVATRASLERLDACELPVRYVASPVGIYRSPRLVRLVDRLANAGREFVLPADGLFTSTGHWRVWWPRVLDRIATVSILADTDGTVGRGVWIEARDASNRGLPLRWEGPGPRHAITISDLVIIDGGTSLRRYAALRAKAPAR
jgi:hypothetical protein